MKYLKLPFKIIIFSHQYLMLVPPYAWSIGLLVKKIDDYFNRFR